jgi:glycosyltransferase involved in cell wall biosynthesis
METNNEKPPLTVWIINQYGNLPGEGSREDRSTLIAKALGDAGHNTVWWVSNFEHRSKTFRTVDWADIQVNPNFLIKVVPSISYTSHISLRRIRYEKIFAQRLYKRAINLPPPDIIILAEPALFKSSQVLKLVKYWQVKLVVDIIDIWPELFHLILPRWLSRIGKLIFYPLYMRRAALFKRADTIVSVTRDYLDIAQKISTTNISEVIYWGVDVKTFEPGNVSSELPEVLGNNPKRPNEFWAIYAGTLGNNYDILTIIQAAEILETLGSSVTILIAGDGPLKNMVQETIKSKKLKNIIYVGNLNAQTLASLFKYCDIALSTYVAGSTVSMPIKAFDYMAAGLPMINSLGRELGSLVIEKNIGTQYSSQNPESLAAAIQHLVNSPDTLRIMSHNARKLATSFDVNVQYKKFVEILERTAQL